MEQNIYDIAVVGAGPAGASLSDVQKRYRKNTRSLRLKLRIKSVKRTLLCTPFTRKLIMQSGIQSIQPYKKK